MAPLLSLLSFLSLVSSNLLPDLVDVISVLVFLSKCLPRCIWNIDLWLKATYWTVYRKYHCLQILAVVRLYRVAGMQLRSPTLINHFLDTRRWQIRWNRSSTKDKVIHKKHGWLSSLLEVIRHCKLFCSQEINFPLWKKKKTLLARISGVCTMNWQIILRTNQ